MNASQYAVISKFIRLSIIHFASSYSIPYNLVLSCLSSNDANLLPNLRDKVKDIKQFLDYLDTLEDTNLPPLSLKEFKKHAIDASILREGVQRFYREDLIWYGKLTLGQAFLSQCYLHPAEDGGLYTENYTELHLLNEANLFELDEGSIRIEWNEQKGSSYEKSYATKKFPLERELTTLSRCCDIEILPLEGDYHKGGILPRESVQILKERGLIIPKSEHEISLYQEGKKIYTALKKENQQSINKSIHQAINTIVSKQINKICQPLLEKRLETQLIGLSKIRLSRFKDLLGIGPLLGANYEYQWQDLILEFENKTAKVKFLPLIASLLKIRPDKLEDDEEDLEENCLALPLSAMQKLFGLSFNEILNESELKIITKRHTYFGEDALDIDNQLLKRASEEILKPQLTREALKSSKVTNFFSQPQRVEKNDITVEQLTTFFQLEPEMIIACKEGLCKSIEITTPDLKTAQQLAQTVRNKMEQGSKKYGGLIRAGGILKNESCVEISFDALNDLKELLNHSRQASLSY